MSIAVDQTRLRHIVDTLFPERALERDQAMTSLQFVQLAAGADHEDQPAEHCVVQSISQIVGSLSGLELEDLLPILPIERDRSRRRWLRSLGANLRERELRELTYAFVFLVLVSDLELTREERAALEEFQLALDIDDRRAMDLVVFLTDAVADA